MESDDYFQDMTAGCRRLYRMRTRSSRFCVSATMSTHCSLNPNPRPYINPKPHISNTAGKRKQPGLRSLKIEQAQQSSQGLPCPRRHRHGEPRVRRFGGHRALELQVLSCFELNQCLVLGLGGAPTVGRVEQRLQVAKASNILKLSA